jgi:formylglycine-generating enzyme
MGAGLVSGQSRHGEDLLVSRIRLVSTAFFCAAISCACVVAARAATIDWVTVGNPGNAPDTTTYGAVSTSFRIMTYEFTNQQYTDFLNAVDPQGTNPDTIYSASMGSNARGGITFNGSNASGSKYAAKTNMGDKPVNYVTWFDAARVSNWLQAGGGTYGTSASGSAAINSGAYTLNGATSGNALAVNANAAFYVPTENQWYKAAYYKGGGTNAGYWQYATQVTGTAPTAVNATTVGTGTSGGVTPVTSGNSANWNYTADWNSQDGNVTTVGTNGGPSAYGAFDMTGNVAEWNDLTATSGTARGVRGGSFTTQTALVLSASSRRLESPSSFSTTGDFLGFRLASAATLVWNTTSGTWNTTSTVWTTIDGGTNAFTNGAAVVFSGTGGGVVTISGSIQPSSITVSAASGTYSLVSSAGNLLIGTTGLTKSGGGTLVLSGSNAFTGQTSVTGGVLLVNGVLSSGTTTVSTGLLGGSGTVSGAVQMAAGGTIAPGAALGSTGILTMNSLSGTSFTIAMEITGTAPGTGYDQISATAVDYSGATLSLSLTGSYANGTAFDLFDFTTQSGTLAGIAPLTASLPAYNGLTWGLATTSTSVFDQRYGSGVWVSSWGSNGQRFIFNQADGVLTVVPEPSTFAMAGAGLAGCALVRWRRARRRGCRSAVFHGGRHHDS